MMKPQLIFIGCVLATSLAHAQATQPADDAAKLYLQAAKLVTDNYAKNIQCPSASNLEWPHGYPPYPEDWMSMEETDFDANADARELAHRARSIDYADWPALGVAVNGSSYLNQCRSLSNEMADASNYQLTLKNYAAAIEVLRDQWHLADLLENAKEKKFIRLLVAVGIRAESLDRFETLIAYADFTNDPHNLRDVQVNLARELISQLLKHPDAKAQVEEFANDYPKKEDPQVMENIIETANRAISERDMAALSLACHLYRLDTGKWPASIDDLHKYLPNVPLDPWGDGKQTLGYVLIKAGLPDGTDRPMVYSRCRSKDGLFFRTDQAAYSFYSGDGSDLPLKQQKQGGQFRDVAGWIVPEGVHLQSGIQLLK